MFKAMLTEFGGEEKRRPYYHKGLFFQDKTVDFRNLRDKIFRYPA
jgi:hypothetical protein